MHDLILPEKPALMPARDFWDNDCQDGDYPHADWQAERLQPTQAFTPRELKEQAGKIAAECEMPEGMALAIAKAMGRRQANSFRALAKAADAPLMAVFAFAHMRHFLDFGALYLFPPLGSRGVSYLKKAASMTLLERARGKGLFSGAAGLEFGKYYAPFLFAGECPDLPQSRGSKSGTA